MIMEMGNFNTRHQKPGETIVTKHTVCKYIKKTRLKLAASVDYKMSLSETDWFVELAVTVSEVPCSERLTSHWLKSYTESD